MLCCLLWAEALLRLDNSFGSYTSSLNEQDNSAAEVNLIHQARQIGILSI